MKPLKFKVKKLYDLDRYGQVPGEYVPLAYQLTPCGDYSDYETLCQTTILHMIKGSITDKWFYVDACSWEQFRDAVHSYNLKYCDVPDVKVLDGFSVWNVERSEKCHSHLNVFILNELIKEYKATLVSPDIWFEMEGE